MQGDNTNINIIKNKIKVDINKKERDSQNAKNAIKKYESEINNLNVNIRKLQDERNNQNIEQKIRNFHAQIIQKTAEQAQLQSDLQMDVNQRQIELTNAQNQLKSATRQGNDWLYDNILQHNESMILNLKEPNQF